MSDAGIRVGRVSSIDYETGMLRVTYKDKGASVTAGMPYANFNREYSMPEIGESVLVAHMSNGSSRGVVIGSMWNKKNRPTENGVTLYRKELSKTPGAAMLRYEEEAGEYLVKAPNVMIHGVNQTDLEGPKVNIAANIQTSFESPVHKAHLGMVTLSGLEEGDIQTEILNNVKVVMELADLEALIKKVTIETAEEMKVTAGKHMELQAEEEFLATAKEIRLEDAGFVSTLGRIMERLEALDQDTSARK